MYTSLMPVNFQCSELDDYRPIQSTLLTRFTSADCSESWRTSNQDYGAFYYRQIQQHCVPDNLKAKLQRRHNRFQDWLLYQAKCQQLSPLTFNSCNSNNVTTSIFPSNTIETVRVTHRKRFLPQCEEEIVSQRPTLETLATCGEDGLITDYIVKRILNKLQCLIGPGESHDVAECAQMLVSEILSQEPCLCTNDIINRVVTIMITPPATQQPMSNNNISCIPCSSQPSCSNNNIQSPCYSNVSNTYMAPNTIQYTSPIGDDSRQPSSKTCSTVSISGPIINCPPPCQDLPLSQEATNVFDKLNALETAISKISAASCSNSC